MATKRFSRALFEENDELARNAGRQFLLLDPKVETIEDNPDRYGADLHYWCEGDKDPRLLECECKLVWKGGEFPYESIQVLFRKTKYFEQGCDLFMLSGDKKTYVFIRATDILTCPVKEIWTKYTSKEKFYDVPKALGRFGVLK